MRIVIQRVLSAAVDIEGHRRSEIGKGMMILVGICDEDTDEDIEYLCQKVVKMRIVARLQELFGYAVQTGEFGADMQVSLVNDGPVTIVMDSHLRETF